MAATEMIHVRVDPHLKANAAQALESMGLSVSDAVRVFLTRVVSDQGMPFALKVPNAETRLAMQEARELTKARFKNSEALFNALDNE
ncbi:MAG: type II toxin-antitoxin system antitoxin, RelB/DinJ family [Thiothrix nivea]|nr:MAG: type II toxin-antitoxin system antitoxin, RelB/DinJ family [Thiothrix nivea]